MGGSFDVEDSGLLKCGMHAAKLNAETMAYEAPPAFMSSMGTKCEKGTVQPEFGVTMNADGSATLAFPEGYKKGGGCEVA